MKISMPAPGPSQEGSSVSSEGTLLVLLAAGLVGRRALPLSREVGVPVAALPYDAAKSLLEAWLEFLRQRWRHSPVVVVLAGAAEMQLFQRVGTDDLVELWAGSNEAEHRGSAGISRDAWMHAVQKRPGLGGAVVVECSMPPDPALLRSMQAAPCADNPWVAIDREGRPLGVSYLPRHSLEFVPSIGYFDLKEQLLPALHRQSQGARPLLVDTVALDCRTRSGYLSFMRSRQDCGADAVASSARIDESAKIMGSSIVSAGAAVEAGAFVIDSIVLPGSRIGRRSVVARSILAPGSVVVPGSLVVDAVVAELPESVRRWA